MTIFLINLIAIVIYPMLIIGSFIYVYRVLNYREVILRNIKSIILFVIFTIIFLNLYSIFHLSHESYIYFWDFSGFWRRAIELEKEFSTNHNLFTYVFNSINFNEYSSLPQLFLLSHILVVGDTYPRFILSMVNYFIIPANILLYIYFMKIKDRYGFENFFFYFPLFTLITFFTGNYIPLIYGYIGSSGIFWIILLLMITENILESNFFRFVDVIVISFILLNLVFLRRWYSYLVLAYFIVTLLISLLKYIHKKEVNIKLILQLLIITGLVSFLIVVFIFPSLFTMFTTYNYKYAYQSVYTGFLSSFPWFVDFYGKFYIIILTFGILSFLHFKNSSKIASFVSSIILIMFLFYQVQIFGTHHYYLINVYVVILIFYGIGFIYRLTYQKKINSFLLILISLLFVFNFLYVSLPKENNIRLFLNNFSPIFTTISVEPRVNVDVNTIRDIVTYMQAETKKFEYTYVLSGSSIFNDDMLRNAFLPNILNPLPFLENTKQLDTRDGIPNDFFKYTYIIVADPIQYHNGEEYQNTIGILANGILHDEELKSHYFLLKSYMLDDNKVKINIFRLIEDIPVEIKLKYSKKFQEIYPDSPFNLTFN